MSAALLDDLLAEFTAPVRIAFAAPTPAKAANPAKSEQPCGFAGDSAAAKGCEFLRKQPPPEADDTPDSQEFASLRRPQIAPQGLHSCASSQDSQDSQGYTPQCAALDAPDLSAVAWTDADIAAFLARRARLMRRGWAESDAERLAERLVRRDREADARVSCVDCGHYRPAKHLCRNHKGALLQGGAIAPALAVLLQHCPGWAATEAGSRARARDATNLEARRRVGHAITGPE